MEDYPNLKQISHTPDLNVYATYKNDDGTIFDDKIEFMGITEGGDAVFLSMDIDCGLSPLFCRPEAASNFAGYVRK